MPRVIPQRRDDATIYLRQIQLSKHSLCREVSKLPCLTHISASLLTCCYSTQLPSPQDTIAMPGCTSWCFIRSFYQSSCWFSSLTDNEERVFVASTAAVPRSQDGYRLTVIANRVGGGKVFFRLSKEVRGFWNSVTRVSGWGLCGCLCAHLATMIGLTILNIVFGQPGIAVWCVLG
jgi:hypothetical protein